LFFRILDGIPVPGFLPEIFEKYYLLYFVLCSSTFLILLALVKLFGPSSYAPVERLGLASGITSGIIPAAMVPYTVWPGVVDFVKKGLNDPSILPTMITHETILKSCAISIGYMTYDLVCMLWFYNDLIRPKKKELRRKGQIGKTLFYQMLMHHILSILCWPYAVTKNAMSWAVGYFMFTEITNCGLNGRSILDILGYGDSTLPGQCISIMWIIQFTIVRIVPIPLLVYFLAMGDYSKLEFVDKILCLLTVPIPFMLNLMWYGQIMAMVMKKLRGKSKKN